MAIKHRVLGLIAIAIVVSLLAYLRDPPWVLSYTYGLSNWEIDADGKATRWTTGHAAFHVPADLRGVDLRLRFKKEPLDWPRTATVTIDDRIVHRVTFADDSWRTVTVMLPNTGTRRARRIDIKLDRVSSGNRGLQLAEVRFLR